MPALTADNVSIIYASHDCNATDDAGIMKCADAGMLPSSDAADHPEISEGQSGLIYTGTEGSVEPSVPTPLGERRRFHYYTVTFSEGAVSEQIDSQLQHVQAGR